MEVLQLGVIETEGERRCNENEVVEEYASRDDYLILTDADFLWRQFPARFFNKFNEFV